MNITLGSSELCWIFDFDEDNEEKVVPHVVLSADVVIKRHMLVLKGLPLKTCHTKMDKNFSRLTRELRLRVQLSISFTKWCRNIPEYGWIPADKANTPFQQKNLQPGPAKFWLKIFLRIPHFGDFKKKYTKSAGHFSSWKQQEYFCTK